MSESSKYQCKCGRVVDLSVSDNPTKDWFLMMRETDALKQYRVYECECGRMFMSANCACCGSTGRVFKPEGEFTVEPTVEP